MKLPHRIAAGGLIFSNNKILLVRYAYGKNGSYLVAPGGELNFNENIEQAIIREVLEETGITVQPKSVIMIEDLICTHYKMCKIWMFCRSSDSKIEKTQYAKNEGIIEVGWYSRDKLDNEILYPSVILTRDWDQIANMTNDIEIPPSRSTSY